MFSGHAAFRAWEMSSPAEYENSNASSGEVPDGLKIVQFGDPVRDPVELESAEFGLGMPTSTMRVLPHPEVCRAVEAGFGTFVDCLVGHSNQCRHAMAFGHGHFCLHPERDQIVKRTAERKSNGVGEG